MRLGFRYNDGGRLASLGTNVRDGHRSKLAGDCVARAIAIASGLPYAEVHAELGRRMQEHAKGRRDRLARAYSSGRKKTHPDHGVARKIYDPYLKELGFKWVPTMGFGTGTTHHLRSGELPKGRIICRVTRHLCAVIDGVINDTHDPSRGGTRCVYGYYIKQ
jgi:hypothetical protein